MHYRGKVVAADVDGTITKENVSYLFGRFLYQKKIISLWSSVLACGVYFLHIIGLCSIASLHVIIFSLLFKGKKRTLLEDAADQFFAMYAHQLFRTEVLHELDFWRKRGATVTLMSSSPDFLVSRIANALSFDGSFSTEYCSDVLGMFSHVGRIVTGSVKAQLVKEIRQTTHASITAMSDSLLDLPLLLEADNVIVVCPQKKLARIAKKRGWRVIL